MAATSPYDELTPERIKANMLSDLEVKGAHIDSREGSYANTLVSVAAYQIYKLYQQFPSLLSMVFPDETAGEYIDKNAAQVGMVRAPGKKATVPVTFTGANGTYIPAGTALYAPESGLQYITTQDATIADGTATAQAEAAEIGADYNLPAGYITSMYINVAGVLSVRNDVAATGGVNEESDADLYARYHARRTLPITSGNKNHYITWATEVTGVAYANCIPLWNGNGTVKVVIAGADRGPVDETIRSACAAYIEENRPIGATVTVVSVAEREIPLTASVTLVEGYSTDQVGDQLEAAVNELLSSQPFGTTVTIPFSRFLACLLQCPGVADYSAYTVDGASAAVTINAGDAPVVGTITIT
ncbi:baseplate J/gp47 family protein [uncultured Dysosmobacter sp.]|uniref:baseplate J/gp47 family protein n=1 Tax=uncultured Dysosmobacter sp. TaxID=2591384 RepID=UPI00262E07B6|nr:baseplate J/gp47 family protein [uncultured Dysosmobacter sp.]